MDTPYIVRLSFDPMSFDLKSIDPKSIDPMLVSPTVLSLSAKEMKKSGLQLYKFVKM